MADLQPGARVPDDITFLGPDGPVRLGDLIGSKVLVLYFYPKDETTGCTAEACSFRDQYQDFQDAGADVVGVSRDSAEDHAKFKANHRLPFRLLTDKGGEAAKRMGVKKDFGLIPGRVTFVIDAQGVVRMRFDSQLKAKKHVGEALEMVRSLARAA
ncbi:MAG: peroxiredoxin [Deltaproteobacteria bacterium]|nr:peroxiredoxin [Kofleriaceae bacterium]